MDNLFIFYSNFVSHYDLNCYKSRVNRHLLFLGSFFLKLFGCLAVTLRHYQEDSLTYSMLITAFVQSQPVGHQESCNEVECPSPIEHLVGF